MNPLLRRFQGFIKDQHLFEPSDTILAAVSGGADSMLMLHLLLEAGYTIGIAHCNFMLRGEESDGDAQFVRDYAQSRQLPLHVIEFATEEYAQEHKLSIEMAARELRYAWFAELRSKFNYTAIAVAHHADDVVETFHINLSRASGLRGLTGIKAKNGDIRRPMLFATRNEIMDAIESEGLSYRTDSSNLEDVYTRNKFRLDVLPKLVQINPSYPQSVLRSIQLLEESYQIVQASVRQAKNACTYIKNGVFTIDIQKIKAFSPLNTYIYELLHDYGINPQQAHDLVKGIDSTEAIEFKTAGALIVKDRASISVLPDLADEGEYLIGMHETAIQQPIALRLSIQTKDAGFQISKDPLIAMLDADLLSFPLTIRRWKAGDSFCPIGMKGKKKKLSDYFTDAKCSAAEKRNGYVLESSGKIAWLIGHRLDERFKISDRTQRILTIRLF